jgi:hypothetical protein
VSPSPRRSSSAEELRALSSQARDSKGLLLRFVHCTPDTAGKDLADADTVRVGVTGEVTVDLPTVFAWQAIRVFQAANPGSGAATITLLVEGHVIKDMIRHHKEAFRNLLLRSDTVICCRATPAQKAELVELIRSAGGQHGDVVATQGYF